MLKELASLLCSLFVPRRSVNGGGVFFLIELFKKEATNA